MASGTVAVCCRCGAALARAKPGSLGRTAALALAALLLYVPANIYPVLRMNLYGIYTQNTVWDGCVRLIQSGQWFVGAIVFAASLMIPLLKLLGLFFLVTTTRVQWAYARKARALILRVIVAQIPLPPGGPAATQRALEPTPSLTLPGANAVGMRR